ncbi:phosphoenolpyruvate synthase [Affinibrenneria salicis]|uniref:Phosphoenolpyruvate synthase n=1 Tax=Affinibrenneria salicis TaxID=2590031 RepID=A0A5J5FS13_9GAMM|nr:PEP/pyruvate-binding domain-containing protein [Affinibrenneria salicis]KAA8995001.1 phosphoenolpyruvate synthase [Affinibrenneria salicis]
MHAVTDFTLLFSDAGAAELSWSGGKGASLARLTAGGLPVPPGFIVTSAAYRAYLAPLAPRIDAILQQGDDVAAQSRRIQDMLRQHPIDDNLARSVNERLQTLQAERWAVAVRSSSTFEDLPGAAFAGQHDTFLNQRGLAEILAALRDCYISLWNEHAMRYRARLNLAHLSASMAVVVQQMVEMTAEDSAGVAFSIDPVQGDLNRVLINACFGLGESVVGGEAAIDEFRVALPAFTVVERNIAHKGDIILKSAQGVRHVPLPAEQADRPSLSDVQCQTVAKLARQAQAFFDFPQDIEWAFSSGVCYLLQSRPVTFVPERWTRDEAAERFPNAVTPLTWDLVEEGFHESLNFSFDLMGLPHFGGKWFAIKDFYIYGNQNAVELYAGRMPGGIHSIDELQARLPELAKRYAWVQDLPIRWMRDLDTYLLEIGALLREDLSARSLEECWRYVLNVRDAGKRYFLPNIAISLTQRTLYAVLYQILSMSMPATEAKATFDLLLSVSDTKTGQVNAELWALSRQIRQDAALTLAFKQHSSRALVERLSHYPAFEQQLTQFLQRHGHRELDFDAYYPTWLEAPHAVLDQLNMLAELADEEVSDQALTAKLAASAAQHRYLNQVPEGLRYFVEEVIRLARVYTYLDDLEHYQTTRLTLPFRKGIKEIGARLVAREVLREADDIYFAPFRAIDDAIRQADFEALTQVIYDNKAGWRQAKQRSPVWNHGEQRCPEDAPTGNELNGLAGSPGTVEGEVFLIHSPDDFPLFPKGAILVARTTNPAWTSLFYRASGVITESGGPLSHGAVTARELQLPAVMSVRGAMSRLANGMRVRLDGKNGMVTVL